MCDMFLELLLKFHTDTVCVFNLFTSFPEVYTDIY